VFRDLLAPLVELEVAVKETSRQLAEVARLLSEQGPARARLEKLELSRELFEAQCEGLLMKAEGQNRAAKNAEARERANKRSYEHLLDPLAEVVDEPEEATRNTDVHVDAEASQEAGMPVVRVGVAPDSKAVAKRAKWGVS